MEQVTRSVPFDVTVPDDQYPLVMRSIKLYRTACRKAFSVCAMAEMAGAEIVEGPKGLSLKPKTGAAKMILAEAFGIRDKKAHLYELRLWLKEVCPTWMSIVPEAIHRDVSDRWKSKDPEITKANRGFLVLQGERALAQFQHIAIPFKNTVPKLYDHTIVAKWDHGIGEVEFRHGKLDGSRYLIWKNLRDGAEGWKLGGMRLTHRNGKLRIFVTFHCPAKSEKLNPEKVATVEFTNEPDAFITMRGPGNLQGDKLGFAAAADALGRVDAKRVKFEEARKAAGSPRRRWGNRKAFKAIVEKSERNSAKRELVVKDFNHNWSRRIADNLRRWKAGVLMVVDMPEREVFGQPWQWAQFRAFLEYKVGEMGGKVYQKTTDTKAA